MATASATTTKRVVEIFHAGCKGCDNTVKMVKELASSADDIQILDMNEPAVLRRARDLGIERFPAILINSKLAACCRGIGPKKTVLRKAGLGKR
jgi:hypothetical protein